MKRISKAAVLTVTAGAAVLGPAGAAIACDHDHGGRDYGHHSWYDRNGDNGNDRSGYGNGDNGKNSNHNGSGDDHNGRGGYDNGGKDNGRSDDDNGGKDNGRSDDDNGKNDGKNGKNDDHSDYDKDKNGKNDDHNGGAKAYGVAYYSPGFFSGNVIQVPIHTQINVCGNQFGHFGLFKTSSRNVCINKD